MNAESPKATARPGDDASRADDDVPRSGEGPAHALEDHALGRDAAHFHKPDEEYDHDHDHFETAGPLGENPIWIQDHVSLTSVGIDIGSSGTQIIFSRIKLRRLGEELSSRYFVVSRETMYQSPVALTPYQNDLRIDQVALEAIIDQAYAAADMKREDVDTGAVILTGEALRRENAAAIARIVAEQGGDFVCAAAGHHMEAMLAAFGSGAARLSKNENKRILNVDMGGGTTKLGVVDGGRVVATAAFHVGGRLQVVDQDLRIVRLDPAGRHLAERAGFSWSMGDRVTPAALDRIAESMADAVIDAVLGENMPADIRELYLTDPLCDLGPIDGVMFSGGVAEYVYDRETQDFGDLGRRLGSAIRRKIDSGALPWPLLPARECIRATALGACEYSVQLSGNTIYISNNAALLPRRNLQIVHPPYDFPETINPDHVARAIRSHLNAFDLSEGEVDVGLAFRWRGAPSYERVAAFAQGIIAGLPRAIAQKRPLFLILDGDLAQTLGRMLREECAVGSEVLVIDGIVLWDFDYIDLGKIRLPSHTVPVTVKSLVFQEDPRVHAIPHEHSHHYLGHGHHHGPTAPPHHQGAPAVRDDEH
jgi:ethanolamine utilization protein EutA